MAPKIIFEDEFLLVVDKPSGLVVNCAETMVKGATLQDWVESRWSKNSEYQNIRVSEHPEFSGCSEFLDRSGIVHRLDKDTSGLLVIAKTPEAFENLKNQFKSREVVKKYLALVHDRVQPCFGAIRAPISRSPFNRMHFGVFPGGREAVTEYKLLKSLKLPKSPKSPRELSLLELIPHTGRTHQIRVHLKYINHPIVSDPIYGGRKNCRDDLRFCPRLFLHATCLKIKHPKTNEAMEFSSPLPPDLEASLSGLLVSV